MHCFFIHIFIFVDTQMVLSALHKFSPPLTFFFFFCIDSTCDSNGNYLYYIAGGIITH